MLHRSEANDETSCNNVLVNGKRQGTDKLQDPAQDTGKNDRRILGPGDPLI